METYVTHRMKPESMRFSVNITTHLVIDVLVVGTIR